MCSKLIAANPDIYAATYTHGIISYVVSGVRGRVGGDGHFFVVRWMHVRHTRRPSTSLPGVSYYSHTHTHTGKFTDLGSGELPYPELKPRDNKNTDFYGRSHTPSRGFNNLPYSIRRSHTPWGRFNNLPHSTVDNTRDPGGSIY